MKKYLITGGNGFIGANIARTLATQEQHNEIHLIVQPGSSLWRLHDIAHKLFIHEIDLIDFQGVTKLILTIKPDVILHLAAFGGMPNEQDQPLIFQVNFNATINLLNACKQVGFECFINTGSSSEYGKKNTAMHEHNVLEPISDYGVAKAAATQFCVKEALVNKLPIYTVRPFSVYGPYEMPTRLIPTIITNSITKQPIKLATPHSVRDFIHIEDLVKLYLAIIEKTPNETFVFNSGTGIQSTVQQVVESVENNISQKLPVIWGSQEPRPWEPIYWQANITLAQEILNWQPTYSLDTGIEKTIAWFEQHLHLYHIGTLHESP